MLKQVLLFSLVTIFLGCDGDKNTLIKPSQPNLNFDNYQTPIMYLNKLRTDAGLRDLKPNSLLDTAALNHAKYCINNNHQGHDETASNHGFSGIDPIKRAFNAEYNSSYVLENISFNKDYKSAIDGLMSAIYHRFSFLNTTINEVGIANFGNTDRWVFVFEMGNSELESFCKKESSDGGNGAFYTKICKNSSTKISQSRYDSFTRQSHANYVLYPTNTAIMPYFSNEIPDPLPECEITANPISVEFNKNNAPVFMKSFNVFDENGKIIENFKVLDQKNDPNRRFTQNQFAYFATEVFDYGKKYRAKFEYTQESTKKVIEWEFATRTPEVPYFVVRGGEKLALEPDMMYEIFFKPKDCNDLISTFNYKYRNLDKPYIQNIAQNSLRISITGSKNGYVDFSLPNGEKVRAVLTNGSKSVIDLRYLAIFSAIGFGLILYVFARFKKSS